MVAQVGTEMRTKSIGRFGREVLSLIGGILWFVIRSTGSLSEYFVKFPENREIQAENKFTAKITVKINYLYFQVKTSV